MLAGLSAGALWAIAERPDVVHILAEAQKRSRKGLVAHRGPLPPGDVRIRQGLALTSPYRTILDLRGRVSAKTLKTIVWEASYKRLITDDEAATALGKKIRRIAGHEGERILVELLTNAGLPAPETNVRLHGWEVDLYWPEQRVALELDGFDAHGHRQGFERDHRKALHLESRGIHILRATGVQLTDAPMTIVATVGGALALRG